MNGNQNGDHEIKQSNGMEKFHHSYTSLPGGENDYYPKKEKPWKRVVDELKRKGVHLYDPVNSIPSTLLIVFLGVNLLFAFFTQLIELEMPRPMTESELGLTNIDRFCEERTWRFLHELMGNEPRVCGTPYHLQKSADLKNLVDGIAASSSLPVHTDWQIATADFWISYFSSGHLTYYQNLSNVIALLEGESGLNNDGTTRSTILVNCHYDSVPFALGVSDDAIFCSVMVEVFNLLSRQPNKLKHNVVFLWNGAEENNLQGSHAFLSHPWFQGVTSVVNLDAAGMNGKATVFQITDPRILYAYQKVTRRPSGQSLGEYLFTTGVIPSDTDFRIWRYYGGIHGVDIAFVKTGAVYHTRNDHPDLVTPGVIQNAGDMLFGLVKEIANMEELADKNSEASAAVYWDFLYGFIASYSYTNAHILDSFMLLFGIASIVHYMWIVGFRKQQTTEFLFAVLGRIICILSGFLVVFILTPIAIATTIELRYISHPWIVVPLYWVPYLVGSVATSQLLDAWRAKRIGFNRCIRTCQAMSASRAIMCLALFVLLCIPSLVTVRYVVMVPLVLMSFASFITLTVNRIYGLQAWQHFLLEYILSIPATMFLFSIAIKLNAMLLPTQGRNASDSPDWSIAIVNAGLATFVPATMAGIELLFSRKRLWMVLSAMLAVCVIIMFIPMDPYVDPAVQRHYWFHTEIVTYSYTGKATDRVSGVLITKHDTHTPDSIIPVLEEMKYNFNVRTDFDEDCEKYVFCNLPLYRLMFHRYLHHSVFLYTSPPTNVVSSLQMIRKDCQGDICTLHFVLNGPPHNMVTFWPRNDTVIRNWSFTSPISPSLFKHERPVYVLIHSHATYSETFEPLEFHLSIAAPRYMQNQPLIDISHHAHKIHHPQDFTPTYTTLLNAMPDYFNVASFLTVRSNYVF